MKKIIISMAGIVLATSLSMGVQAAAVPGATLRVAYDSDPVSLDPHEQLSGGTLQMSHLLFDPLVRWDKGMEFEPLWRLNGNALMS